MPRPRPRPRGTPPPRRLPPIPPAFVGQEVATSFGGSFRTILDTIALLIADNPGNTIGFQAPGQGGVGKTWRLPTSPQAGVALWQPEHDITILTLCLPSVANVNFGMSTSGMTIANFNGNDDGGILFMGTWNQINPQVVNWRINRGQTLTISKNNASNIDVLISYVAHVG